MEFLIDRPKTIAGKNKRDKTVSEALYSIYKEDAGWLLTIVWNENKILLDGIMIADILKDVLKMLQLVNQNEKEFKVFFLDSGLTAEWRISTVNDELNIDARWTAVTSEENYALEKLRQKPIIQVDKRTFIDNWKKLLNVLKEDLTKAGYTQKLIGFKELNDLLD